MFYLLKVKNVLKLFYFYFLTVFPDKYFMYQLVARACQFSQMSGDSFPQQSWCQHPMTQRLRAENSTYPEHTLCLMNRLSPY